MKKGFTLVELLAVIIILGLIALISTPIVLNVVEDAKINAGLSEANLIYNEIIKYCDTEDIHKLENYEKICTNDKIKDNVDEIVKLGNMEILEIQYKNHLNWLKLKKGKYIFSLSNEKMILKDIDRPNDPDLLNNTLIPIKYDGSKWIYADINKEWYNYEKKEWANAVIVNKDVKLKIDNKLIKPGDEIKAEYIDLWYVWIPRYKYQLFNIEGKKSKEQEINIKFEKDIDNSGIVKCEDTISGESTNESEKCYRKDNKLEIKNGDWYTHPAFTINNIQLNGIWVSKFELSGTSDKITTKPNTNTLLHLNISDFNKLIKLISSNYKINGNSHMITNMEWGAITFLSQSKYGKSKEDIMPNTSYKGTGGGINLDYKDNLNQSTTLNIYGIFDMAGGAYEYVLGNMVDQEGKINISASGFSDDIYSENIDLYNFGTNTQAYTFHGKLGDATKETKNWYNDAGAFPFYNTSTKIMYSWFSRGGMGSNNKKDGLFFYDYNDGSSSFTSTTRSILIKNY